MGWSATMIGALLGLGTLMYSNGLGPLASNLICVIYPWQHVVGMGLGAVFVNKLEQWDAKLGVEFDRMLEKAKAADDERRNIDENE